MTERHWSRRRFLGALAAAAVAGCDSTDPNVQDIGAATLDSRPRQPTLGIATGWQSIGLGDARGGLIYAPPTYDREVPAPLAVLLHGGGLSSESWRSGSASEYADAHGAVLLCPDSRGTTWDRVQRGLYGEDIAFIDSALDLTFDLCNVDPARICLGGFSDGAGYALSVGVANGDLFSAIMGFSPGFFLPLGRRGKPRVFISHGTADPILPFDYTDGTIVPQLRREGYDVEFAPFPNTHIVPGYIGEQAFDWWVGNG